MDVTEKLNNVLKYYNRKFPGRCISNIEYPIRLLIWRPVWAPISKSHSLIGGGVKI